MNLEHNTINLIFKPDAWLDNHLASLLQELIELRREIQAAKHAKAIKRDLQNSNMVIVADIASCISIVPAPEAVKILAEDIACNSSIQSNLHAIRNAITQISVWETDGYTINQDSEDV